MLAFQATSHFAETEAFKAYHGFFALFLEEFCDCSILSCGLALQFERRRQMLSIVSLHRTPNMLLYLSTAEDVLNN